MSTQEENKALVRRLFERIDQADITALDDMLVEGYSDHNPPPFPGLPPGIQGARAAFALALQAFSNFQHTIDEQFADGDRVISRITASGTHTGPFLGVPATGRDVSMTGIAIHRAQDGKLAEHWAQIDALSLLVQIGIVPPLG